MKQLPLLKNGQLFLLESIINLATVVNAFTLTQSRIRASNLAHLLLLSEKKGFGDEGNFCVMHCL